MTKFENDVNSAIAYVQEIQCKNLFDGAIIKAPDYMKYKGFNIAQVITVSTKSKAFKEKKANIIIIDENFEKLDSMGKRFFIEHEKAHIKLGHYKNKSKFVEAFSFIEMAKGKIHLQERKADQEAAKIIGLENAIYALHQAQQLIVDVDTKDKFARRLKALTNNE